MAYSKDDAKITLIGVGIGRVTANIFEPLSKAQINVDMVIQIFHQIKKLRMLHLL